MHLGSEPQDEPTEELEYPLQIVLEVAYHSTQFSYQRGDGYRGQTKGRTRAVGQRGRAQATAESDEEFKGRKRHRGRKGGTAQGKRPKGDGS